MEFVHDLSHGVRLLVRRPGFAAVAILSLALGIGLNTTLFSVVNAVLFRTTAVSHPDRLVEIYSSASADFPHFTTSYPDYLSILEGTDAFQGVAGHAFVRGILSSGGKPLLVTGEAVTASYFDVLGIRPALGRAFREEENVGEGQHTVLVMGHGMWQRRFGGRPDILDQTVVLSGVPYTVVGVAPAGFSGVVPGLQPEFWVPAMMVDRLSFGGLQATTDSEPGATRIQQRGNRWLFLKGRLADGRTLEEAQAQVETVFARLRTEYTGTNEKTKGTVMSAAGIRFHPMLDGYVKGASAVLLAAVGLVLMIACANVANMLLARGGLPHPRARGACRHRREPRPAGAAAPEREPGAGRGRRSARGARGGVGDPPPRRHSAGSPAIARPFRPARRPHRACFRGPRVPGHHRALRPRSRRGPRPDPPSSRR